MKNHGEIKKEGCAGKDNMIRLYSILSGIFIIAIFSLHGCSSKPPSAPSAPQKKQTAAQTAAPAVAQPGTSVEESPIQEGYIYDRRDRRDPFVPLLVPKKKTIKRDITKAGTLEDYDFAEFALAAIAKKAGKYYALLTAPDSRSFTVNEGTIIGLSKGKVKEITFEKIVLIEFSRDFKGQLKPREVILELRKGEVK